MYTIYVFFKHLIASIYLYDAMYFEHTCTCTCNYGKNYTCTCSLQ